MIKEEDISQEDPEELFEMLDIIGEGSFGLVCTCRNIKQDIIYAIKFLETEEGDDQCLQKEIDILKETSSCANIVRYFGCYLKENTYMIVMEYCEGGSVLDIMKMCKKTLNEEQIQVISLHVLQGLKYLHSHRIMHRDLKAGNILLSIDGKAKLADFGVSAKLTSTIQKKNTVVGSPYWMAPEVINVQSDQDGYDFKADIWSLGITGIELAEGKPPLFDIASLRVIFLIPAREPPTLKDQSQWSHEFNNFIAKCLQKDPVKRPLVEELLEHPFVKKGIAKDYVLRQLVLDSLPALNSERKKRKEKAKEEGLTEEYSPGTVISVNPGAGTYGTSVVHSDDDDDDDDPSGTVVVNDRRDGTAILNRGKTNVKLEVNLDDDEEEDEDDGTVVLN